MKKTCIFVRTVLVVLVLTMIAACLSGCGDQNSGSKVAETQSVDLLNSVKENLVGAWYDEGENCVATFYESGNSELSFANTLTHYEVLSDGTLQLSDRYGDMTALVLVDDKDVALSDSASYYVSADMLVIEEMELFKK